MKKIMILMGLFLVPCICIAAAETKKETKKEPAKKEVVEPAKETKKEVKAGSEVIADDFEGEKTEWKGLAFLLSGGGRKKQWKIL